MKPGIPFAPAVVLFGALLLATAAPSAAPASDDGAAAGLALDRDGAGADPHHDGRRRSDHRPHGAPTGPFGLSWGSTGVPTGLACVAVGDIDLDGRLDIVAQDYAPPRGDLLVFEEDDAGGFVEVARTSGAQGRRVQAVTTGDTDGDGLQEIIASYYWNTNVSVFEWSPASGRYGLVSSWQTWAGSDGERVTDLFVADTNNNGRQEIIVLSDLPAPVNGTSPGTGIRIREQSGIPGANAYTEVFRRSTGVWKAWGAAIGDVDHDGWTDLVLGVGYYPADIWRFEYDATAGTWVEKRFACAVRIQGHSPRVVDLDHDDRQELVYLTEWSYAHPAVALVESAADDSFHVALRTPDILGRSASEELAATPALPRAHRQPGAVAMRDYNGKVSVWELARDRRSFELVDRFTMAAPWNWHDFEMVVGPHRQGLAVVACDENGVRVYRQGEPDSAVVAAGSAAPAPLPAADAGLKVAPNPFNPRAVATFALPRADRVRVSVHDMRGRLVRVLADEAFAEGEHRLSWDGLDRDGRAAPSGTYVFRVEGGGATATTKAMLVR